jgi:hypothetical protein
MIDFVRNLFGINLVEDDEILKAVQNILGYETTKGLIRLNRALLYTYCIKNCG